jgi:signal transduction histidine kinase
MNDRHRIRAGRLVGGVSVAVGITAMGILIVLGRRDFLIDGYAIESGILAIGLGAVTLVTITAQPRNREVWVLAWAGALSALSVAGVASAVVWGRVSISGFSLRIAEASRLSASDLPLPIGLVAGSSGWAFFFAFFLLATFGLLLFPDGKVSSPRSRWVARYCGVTFVLAPLLWILLFRPSGTTPLFGAIEPTGASGQILYVGFVLGVTGACLSVAGLVARYRSSDEVTRRQIRWIAWSGAILVVTAVAVFAPQLIAGDFGASEPLALAFVAAEALFLGSFAVAITRYRLFDIDVVISRTVTYGALAVFITTVYVVVVAGIGELIGQGDKPNVVLAIGATAAVALLFEPVRSRVQRWANRLVYGERATPYAVLSELTVRYADTESNEQALRRLVELVASGTGAAEAVVWLRVGDRLRPEAVTAGVAPPPVVVDGGDVPELQGDVAEPIYQAGELLGALSIVKERGDAVTPSDRQLLQDVAAGAGLLLRNIRLNAELADRAEELRVSRRRLVAAQDAERRRLERNLHDGAQQQVVALKVKLGLARTLAEREGVDEVAMAVGGLAEDTQRAVDGMRMVARGIYPPLLEAEGLRPALLAIARDAGIRVTVVADDIGRYAAEVEATVYFSVLEAITQPTTPNAAARVTVRDDEGSLVFTIEGVDLTRYPGSTTVVDRVEALGGTLRHDRVTNTITGRLPTRSLEPA